MWKNALNKVHSVQIYPKVHFKIISCMFISASELTNKKTVPRLAPQFDMEVHHDPTAPFLARDKKHRSTELVTLFSLNKGQTAWTVPLTILLDPFSLKNKQKKKTKIQPYLMRGEGHKDANAT